MRKEATPPPIALDKGNPAPPALQVSGSLCKANVVARTGKKVRQRSRMQTEHSNLLIKKCSESKRHRSGVNGAEGIKPISTQSCIKIIPQCMDHL